LRYASVGLVVLKTRWLSTHSIIQYDEMEKRTRVLYRNWATRVSSVRWSNNSLIIRHKQVIKQLKVI